MTPVTGHDAAAVDPALLDTFAATGIVKLTGVFHPVGSELTAAEAKRSKINAFGIQYEGKTGLSAPFSWAA